MIIADRASAFNDRVSILCEIDGILIRDFSRRSLDRMKPHSFLSRSISFFLKYMESNVNKEIEKDGLIIREAASAFKQGRPACDLDLEEIFEKTKEVDRVFLEHLAIPSFTLSVRYSDIADIRLRRIWRMSKTVYRILENWETGLGFAEAARRSFTAEEFRDVIVKILHLYNLETRMLPDSVRSPFPKAVSAYAEKLYHSMEATMEELARVYSNKIYGDKRVHV